MKTSAEVLEFEALKQVVGRYISSAPGRRELEKLEPHADRARLEEDLAEASEAIEYLRLAARPQPAARGAAIRVEFGGLPDTEEIVHKLRIEGASLEPKEIFAVFSLLDRAADAKSLLTATAERFPRLARRAQTIGDFRALLRDLEGKILPDGTVADHASVALARLRRDIERQKRAIQESLERFLRAHREEGVLQEEFVTIRNERFVVPIIAGQRRKLDAAVIGARADRPFASVDDLWRRAGVPAACLVQIAEADAFQPLMKLARREALWAIKALRDEPLPLFAAASAREAGTVAEINEPAVALRPMTAGGEVVEDYGHVGLSLRAHPVSFLREDLRRKGVATCAEAMQARDGRRVRAAGLVLVRQMPGSAKGVMFMTIEDETGIANLVIWPKLFEKQRRVILAAGMLAVDGWIQREGDIVHLVARRLADLSRLLASVGTRDLAVPPPDGRDDQLHHASPGLDRRETPMDLRTPRAPHLSTSMRSR